jgi:hypothetical protein
MNSEDLIPITDSTLKDFERAKEENRLKTVYIKRWIAHKKKQFSNFLSYAFDKEGNLYRRDFLTANGWQKVNNFIEDDLKR